MFRRTKPLNASLCSFSDGEAMDHADAGSRSIVAVPGLGAHPEWTWIRKTENGIIHWLRDATMLPSRVENARIMVFEYASQWFGENSVDQTLDNLANLLIMALERERRSKVNPVPSISAVPFEAHKPLI